MSSQPTPKADELQAALEDVRRIRALLDDMGEQNPLRVLMRPLFVLGLVFAPFFVLFGVLAQWTFEAPGPVVFGLAKSTVYWLLGGLLAVLGSTLKWLVARRATREKGIDFAKAMKGVFTVGYMRIIVPAFLGLCFLCVYLVQADRAYDIAGVFALIYGLILVAMPLALPIPNITGVGYAMILLGGISLFVWPMYPFYKVAVLFGGACLWMGLSGLRAAEDSG